MAFPAVALIFRCPFRQIQAQSRFASYTRNIPELGISRNTPLTEYYTNLRSTLTMLGALEFFPDAGQTSSPCKLKEPLGLDTEHPALPVVLVLRATDGSL